MNEDLIDGKQSTPAEENRDWAGPINDEETYAHNVAAKKAHEAELAKEDRLSTLSDAELLEEWQREVAKEEARTLPQRQIDAVHRCIAPTPELVLNPKKQQRIDMYLKAAQLDATDPAHFDQAYRSLSARGLLDVDESKRARQPYQRHTEEDLYDLPLEQLEKLARKR